jgi:hypothetical protein
MSENRPKTFYGCFNGSHQKMYRWQCKAFATEKEATDYALIHSKNSDIPLTFLVEASQYSPKFMHVWGIEKAIKSQIKVEIIE